jgi:hypothetical protein
MPKKLATSFALASAGPEPIVEMSHASSGLASMWRPSRVTPTYVRAPSSACAMRKRTTATSPKRDLL